MFRKYLTSVITIILLAGISCPGLALDLRTAAQDSSPKYQRLSDNEMGGICVDIMHAIERLDAGIRFDGYQDFMPFKRLQLYLETGELDVFFGLKNSAERLSKYIFSEIPLYQLNYVVAIRSEDQISIESIDEIRSLGGQGDLLTVFGSAASRFLKNSGELSFNDSPPTPLRMIDALLAGRGRFAFYHDLGMHEVISSEGLERRVRILPVTFSTYHHYAAYSKSLPTETVDRINAALQKLKDDGTLAGINRKYGLFN